MIISRTVFRLKFGKAKEAIELIHEAKKLSDELGYKFGRAFADITGPSYTIVLETEADDLADFEKQLAKVFSNDRWKSWYQKFMPLIESSHRDLYKVIA